MGNRASQVKIGFEELQQKIGNKSCVIINTLNESMQNCLIPQTVLCRDEESAINKLLKNNSNMEIIIYGMNNNDESVIKKYKQLVSLGFENTYIYLGGMFEWLLLQDIYGNDNFPTTSRELDIMKYKPVKNNIS